MSAFHQIATRRVIHASADSLTNAFAANHLDGKEVSKQIKKLKDV